jgi:hypothetical protein
MSVTDVRLLRIGAEIALRQRKGLNFFGATRRIGAFLALHQWSGALRAKILWMTAILEKGFSATQ